MDLICPRCGEPWDFDCLHEEASVVYGVPYYSGQTPGEYVSPGSKPKNPEYNSDEYDKVFQQVRRTFQTSGCGVALAKAYTDGVECEKVNNNRTAAAGAMYDLLGDDIDGAAAMLEDAEMMGMFDND